MEKEVCMMKQKGLLKQLLQHTAEHIVLNTKVVRIFNTYGPRMQLNDGRVVTNFIVQALNNERYNYLWRWFTD